MNPFAVTAYAVNVCLAVTIVSLIALLAIRLTLRHNPSARYLLCLIALIAILLTPFVVGIQDRMGFSLFTLSLPGSLAIPSVDPASPDRMADSRNPAIAPMLSGIAALGMGFLILWASGVAWGTVRLIRGWQEVSRLTQGIRAWNGEARPEVRANVERVLGCILPPVYTSPHVASPVAVGLLRPIVLLPEGWTEALPLTQLQQILLHECAHIVYRHTLGGIVERVTRLLFWMHPLIPFLCRELARAREEVCDNVAAQENGATCYARTLFTLAQGSEIAPNSTSLLALLGPETSMEDRISGLLHPRRNRMVRIKQGKLWAVTGVAVLAVVSTVAVRVVAATGNPSADRESFPASQTSERRVRTPNSTGSPDNHRAPRLVLKPVQADGSSNLVVVTAEGKPLTISSGTSTYSVNLKGGSQDHDDELQEVRVEEDLREVQLKRAHDHALHHFFAHIHQMFGGLFRGFHPVSTDSAVEGHVIVETVVDKHPNP